MISCWRLDTNSQTLVLVARDGGMAEALHWGARLPDEEDLVQLDRACRPDVTGGMLDETPPLSILPEARRSFPGQTGLQLRDGQGRVLLPVWRLEEAAEQDGALSLTYRDPELGLTYRADFKAYAGSGVIRTQAFLASTQPVQVDWFAAPVLPGPQHCDRMIDFSGRWCGEFSPVVTPWSAGIRLRDNRTGRSGHEHFPGVILPAPGASNTAGSSHALTYGWSGGHRMLAEELPDGRRQVQFGHAFGSETLPGQQFETAPLYLSYSEAGQNGCAIAFQRHLRAHLLPEVIWSKPRPVHYNCWEAIYFDHDLEVLKDIAARAADLGAERFVLDDGWFGRRDDDTSSLGDWVIDKRKHPEGLGPLIAHVESLGMRFGLWFEPEMINEDSDLFRAHPEWVLGPADQIRGRGQLVLDMSRQDVRDYLFGAMSALLSAYPIDYVKWDHNRVLPLGPDAGQARGTLDLLRRLTGAFPAVEFESCASGGGRIDFGILELCGRVWLSDSNDALERMRMQNEAARFLPAAVTGSHVGPRHCHTSGRTLDMTLRAWVAASRHMGFEMDPRELDEREAGILKEATAWFKANRGWMMGADLYRLDTDDVTLIPEMHVAEHGERFAVFAGRMAAAPQILPRPLRLTGLEPESLYTVSLKTPLTMPGKSRGPSALKTGSVTLSGRVLMTVGLTLPCAAPESMMLIEGRRL